MKSKVKEIVLIYEDGSKCGENSTAGKIYTLIDPNGNEITFKSMANFCKEHNLSKKSMFNLLRGWGRRRCGKIYKLLKYKGYKKHDSI